MTVDAVTVDAVTVDAVTVDAVTVDAVTVDAGCDGPGSASARSSGPCRDIRDSLSVELLDHPRLRLGYLQ